MDSHKREIISIKEDKGTLLSPSQRTFNRLAERIAKLKALLVKDKESLEYLYRLYMENISGAEDEIAGLKLELAALLSQASQKWKFTKMQRENMREVILFLCAEAFMVIEPTPEQQAVYDAWSETTYQQELEEQNKGFEDLIAQQFKQMFGASFEMDGLDMSDPEFFEKLKAKVESSMGQSAPFSAGEGAPPVRKKAKKQLDREQRLKEAEELQQKSIRSIYLSLVKLLHPDRASSEQDRQEKEMLIKKVTRAYQEKDLASLLELEAQWLLNATESLAEISEDKLKLYITSLREKVKELEGQRWRQKTDPKYQMVSDLVGMSPKKAAAYFSDQAQERQFFLMGISGDIELLQANPTKGAVLELVAAISEAMDYEDDPFGTDFW